MSVCRFPSSVPLGESSFENSESLDGMDREKSNPRYHEIWAKGIEVTWIKLTAELSLKVRVTLGNLMETLLSQRDKLYTHPSCWVLPHCPQKVGSEVYVYT